MLWSRRTCCIFRAALVITRATRPRGMLMKKIHSQPGPSAKKPPRTGPSTEETPKVNAKYAW